MPVVVLSPLALLLGAFYADQSLVAPGYGLARAGAATTALYVVGPLVAVAASWEMHVLRSFWGRWTVRRSWLRVLTSRVGSVAATGTLVVLLVEAFLVARPPLSPPGWALPALAVLGVLCWTCFGVAAGLLFGRVTAIAVSLLVPYLVMVLPAGWSPLWLRHLTGVLFDCCTTSTVLDMRAWRASVASLLALSVLSLCVAAVRLAPAASPPRRLGVVGAVATTTLLALVVPILDARELGALPSRPRAADQLQCGDGICLWPEDASARSANVTAREQVLGAWTRLGLPVPTEDFGPVAAEGVLPVASTWTSADRAAASIAQQLPRAMKGCQDDYENPVTNAQLDSLSHLVLSSAGIDPALTGIVLTEVPEPAQATALWAAVADC